MSHSVLSVLVLLSAQIVLVYSLVALRNPASDIITDLEAFLPYSYRAPLFPMCQIIVLSKSPTPWRSSLRPVILTSNFSNVGMVTRCTFLYVFCNDEDPHELAEKTHNFIQLQRKLIQKILIVVLFLRDTNEQHHNLERLAEVINKRVVYVKNGRPLKYKRMHRICEPQDIKCFLQGRKVTIVYSQFKPYVFLTNWTGVDNPQQLVLSPANVHIVGAKLVGFEAELLKLICQKYNMTLNLLMYQHGTVLPNGTWTGRLGVFNKGKIDIVVSRLPGNYRRNQIAHHSSYIYYTCYNIISLKRGRLTSLLAPLRPFTQTVWYGIGISVVLVGVSLWLVVRFHAWLIDFHCELTILQAVVFVAGSLVKVPWSEAQHRTPRALVGVWLLMTTILQASYSSRLMLSYSIADYEKNPKTVDEIISMERTALVINEGTSSAILRGYNQLHVEAFPHEVSPAELTDPTNVVISDPTRYRFTIMDSGGRPLSDYHFGRKPILQIFSGWLYAFEFDLSHSIDLAILRAGQFGLISQWTREQQLHLRQLEEREKQGEDHAEFKNEAITLWNLQAVFLVFVMGNLYATVVLIVEKLICSRIANY